MVLNSCPTVLIFLLGQFAKDSAYMYSVTLRMYRIVVTTQDVQTSERGCEAAFTMHVS